MPSLFVIASLILIAIALYFKRTNPLWLTVLAVLLNVFYMSILMFADPAQQVLTLIGICQASFFAWYAIRDLVGLPRGSRTDTLNKS